VPEYSSRYIKFDGPFCDSPMGTTAILEYVVLYKYYGDTRTMEKAYPMDGQICQYLEGQGKKLLLVSGDWLDVWP